MSAILFLLIPILLFATIYLRSPKHIGAIGEKKVAKQLRKLDKNDFRVFNDVLLSSNGKFCQIDHLVISIWGVFVIETKNYSGWIFGSENNEYWTQVIFKQKTRFRNPIKQNWSHIYFLKNIISERSNITYIPIVVFAGTAELKAIHADCAVTYVEILNAVISQKCKNQCMSRNEVNEVAELFEMINISKIRSLRNEHIRQIKEHIADQ